jgi:hypothetical protein
MFLSSETEFRSLLLRPPLCPPVGFMRPSLTNSMDQSPFCEAKRSKLLKKFPAFYGTRRSIIVVTRAHHMSLFWVRSIQSMPPFNLSKIHFNIILPSMPGCYRWSHSHRFLHHNTICTSPLPHTCHMSGQSQSSWLHHPNDIWWGVRSIAPSYVVI